ncbi:MAG TPA: hypothetical protein PLR85_06625 [Nitrospira sp.]|nr:hypothetical protein [Nitrospira sp.]HNA47915.1 hypothetical protein [Nitrospira sp.]HNG02613.1 hypothetical protein [Nitrospira sp.]HNG53031.1 hypothetical protein [Nitrospira sp.]HNI18178.1 hypothetical protein [Nitrospira sp.]
MINYDEETNQYVNCVDPDVSIADAVNLVSWLIETHASRLRDRYIKPVSPYEAASWPLKLAEAKAGGGPMLQAEADARGVDLSVIVEKVMDKAQALAGLEAMIAGVSGKHRDAISAKEDAHSVLDYDWSIGWPE